MITQISVGLSKSPLASAPGWSLNCLYPRPRRAQCSSDGGPRNDNHNCIESMIWIDEAFQKAAKASLWPDVTRRGSRNPSARESKVSLRTPS